MTRGAPNKRGLEYFPKMLNFYEDDKIFDLLDEYGPLGVTVYDAILTIVYVNGYYAELSADKLSRMVIKKIGNKWIKNKMVVVQVIDYCAELGLIDKDLLAQNIITSVGIQKRYYKVAVQLMKRQLYSDEYWLLEIPEKKKKEEPLLNAPKNGISSEENNINSEVKQISSEESHIKQKEIKENYIDAAPPGKYFLNDELNKTFLLYLAKRQSNGDVLLKEEIDILRKELLDIADNDTGRIAAARKAFTSGWKSFYPVKQKQESKPKKKAKADNKFNNFHQREYDYEKLEKEILTRQMEK